MAFEEIIPYLYLFTFFICLRTFKISSENYNRLPDKLPVHFNIKGQADKWCKKSKPAVYAMPWLNTCIFAMMCGMMIFIYKETGPLPDDFNFALWFFTFSLTYLLYKTQTGMIRYSTGEIKSTWPETGKATILLSLSSLLLIALPFVPSKPEIPEAVMCAKLENMIPGDVRDTFYSSDAYATLFLKLKNVKKSHLVKMVWLNPEGKEHYIDERNTPRKMLAKYYYRWSFIYIKNNIHNIMPGQWLVNVFIDGEKILEKKFSISFQ